MPRVARRPKKHTCESCGKSFGGGGDLTRHIEGVHLKRKPHQCHLCTRSFTQRSALKSHINTHTREKPHRCQIGNCQKSFGDPSSRSRHMRETHGNEPSYQCSGFHPCQSKQRRKSSMKSHLKSKHKLRLPEDEMEILLLSLQVPRDEPDYQELTPFTDSDHELRTPPTIKQHLPSPSSSRLIATPLPQCSDKLPDELSFYPNPTLQIQGQDLAYDSLYDSSPSIMPGPGYLLGGSDHPYSRTTGMHTTGLRGAFAGGDDLGYGRNLPYQHSFPYISQNGYLSVSSPSSSSASPLAMSPSPEPCLGYNPVSFTSPSTSQSEQVYFGPGSTGADWSQPADPIYTFNFS